jgi:hypothetical protein
LEIAKQHTQSHSWPPGLRYHPYWRRAWITQEVLLARRLTLCARHVELDAGSLRSLRARGAIGETPSQVEDLIFLKPEVKRTDLITLIELYHTKDCHIARDRIYALLSICGEGSRVRVDYQSSDGEVLLETMRSCPRSLCVCSVACVASALDYRIPSKKRPRWEPSEETADRLLARQKLKERKHGPAALRVPRVGPLFAQLLARRANWDSSDCWRAKCWNCGFTWLNINGNKLINFVVCLKRVCMRSHHHLVVITHTNQYSHRIRRCILVHPNQRPEGDLPLSDVGLTPSGSDGFNLCVSLACAAAIRPMGVPTFCHLYRMRSAADREKASGEDEDRMQLCNHESHGHNVFE